MDLSKMKNDKKLYLCRWYYRAGFAFLPFLWCVNAVWFFAEAFRKPPYEEQREIRKYVVMSGIGTIIWTAALTTWITVFQLYRAEWGETGDWISFIIPTGIP
ncbi:Gamma-secretase subunit PEN-2 [Cryptotermes secundus]|uniref:Gamma-secretase subunit PEN-2 n=1 Tax=Cryptotermes secundus TaxID=105785 RepID=A0A2J7RA64_9NEOP|nr:gamma-secretase subunit PEN-2 [Cryptotermes secundus]PNF37725.1 Gamma-secretase subunit PEN-2 [Cryptotermes secundus]